MKLNRNFLSGVLCGGVLAGGLTFFLHPSDAAENAAKVVLENDRVRVRELRFEPGVKPGMHTHPYAHVGVILDDGTLQFNDPGGKNERVNFKSGAVGWRDANVTHEVVNVGESPLRVIEVEIK